MTFCTRMCGLYQGSLNNGHVKRHFTLSTGRGWIRTHVSVYASTSSYSSCDADSDADTDADTDAIHCL